MPGRIQPTAIVDRLVLTSWRHNTDKLEGCVGCVFELVQLVIIDIGIIASIQGVALFIGVDQRTGPTYDHHQMRIPVLVKRRCCVGLQIEMPQYELVATVIRANHYVFRDAFSPGEINNLAIFEIFNDHGSFPESILWSEATSDRVVVSMDGEVGTLSCRSTSTHFYTTTRVRISAPVLHSGVLQVDQDAAVEAN